MPLVNVQSPARSDIKRHPSPYYYGDLYKNKADESPFKTAPARCRKSLSLSVKSADEVRSTQAQSSDQNQNNNQKSNFSKYRKSASLDVPVVEEPQISRAKQTKIASNEAEMPHNRLTSSPCGCSVPDDGLDDEMTCQRHVYETAFDCRISKSDDDLDEMDKLSNHPVIVQLNEKDAVFPEAPSIEIDTANSGKKATLVCPKPNQGDNNSISALSQNLQEMQLKPAEEIASTASGISMPLRGYTPSPPSTAPLPTKFHGKDVVMNSIRSAPNLPCHPKCRVKDLRLPTKSLRGRSSTTSSGSLQTQGSIFDIEFGGASSESISEFKGRPSQVKDGPKFSKDRILEIKDRPRKDLLLVKRSKDPKETILEFKGRRRRHKYSSTESMTTSSSGGSMESIRSSTSEGNRSTTSSESHHSSSLSSHESDNGDNLTYSTPQTSGFLNHSNKLHILSPISDKSSQEPISETSDNNRNNNSQKCSPEETATTPENTKSKRRMPQNKNLLNIGCHTGDPEIQGSDSGISIHSREGVKSRFSFGAELSAPGQDGSELPFDMPKLRRRRLVPQDVCTSGSATSVDLRDLPFDMPKLRRRLRIQQSSTESSVSQASSSQSFVEADKQGKPHFIILNLRK